MEVPDDRRDRRGILTTAADLVFTGGREGYFQALDARTGALLWKASSAGRSPRRRSRIRSRAGSTSPSPRAMLSSSTD